MFPVVVLHLLLLVVYVLEFRLGIQSWVGFQGENPSARFRTHVRKY